MNSLTQVHHTVNQPKVKSIFPQLLSFELSYHVKQAGFWMATLFFAWMSMVLASQRGTEQILATSAFTITQVLLVIGPHIIFVVCVLASSVMLRDKQYQMEPLIFATPIDKFHYLASRYVALVAATVLLFVICLGGMMLGLLLVSPAKIGQFELINYLQPFLLFSLPNIILCCSLVFAVGMLTQSSIAMYVGAIVFYVFYMIGSMLGNSPLLIGSSPLQNSGQGISAIIEPYGVIAFYQQSMFWNNDVRNIAMAELSGDLLLNRLLWLALSTALFTLTYKLYGFRAENKRLKTDKEHEDKTNNYRKLGYFTVVPQVLVSQWAEHNIHSQILWSKVKIEYQNVVKGPTFFVLLIACIAFTLFSIANTIFNGPAVGMSPYYPTTAMMLDIMAIPAERLGMLVAIFYAVELYWHERYIKMSSLVDASPTTNFTFYMAKVVTLLAVVFSLISVCVLSAIGFQISQGNWDLRLDLYIQLYFYVGAPVLSVCLFTLFLQRFATVKAIGLLFGFMLFIGSVAVRRAGIEHPLLTPFYQPYFIYSDMADTLYHSKAVFWYNSYWLSLSLVAAIVSIKYWLRGNNTKAQKLGGGLQTMMACFVTLSIACGSYIYYQTNIVNEYKSSDDLNRFYGAYESKYQEFEDKPQPTIKKLKIEGAFYPSEHRFDISGVMVAKNLTQEPIVKILIGFYHQPHLTQSLNVTLNGSDRQNVNLVEKDQRFHSYLYQLDNPLEVGESITVNFTMSLIYNGFTELDGEHYVTKGGAYVEFEDLMPQFGFNSNYMLLDTRKRFELGLEPVNWQSPDDVKPLIHDDWLEFEATISTTAPQQVVTVGALQKRWQENGRNYAHFKSEQDIIAQLAIMSAEYNEFSAHHNGVDISIYHSPKHNKDNHDLVDALTYSMDYFNQHIGKYPGSHFSVVELPYFSSAQSFGSAQPGMYVGVENRFFHLNNQGNETNQHLSSVAHEFGHQYFAFALEPNIIGGYAMLTEVLAEYAELAVTKSRYGQYSNNDDVKRAIDRYLSSRAYSSDTEQPLYRTGMVPHVYYDKGKQTMHALMALIGEDKINQALSIMLAEHGYPNKPTSLDLLNVLYRVAPETRHQRIDELFKTVTLHDFSLTVQKSDVKGVDLIVNSSKVAIDEQGSHKQPLNEAVQIGVYKGYPKSDNSNLLHMYDYVLLKANTTISLPFVDGASHAVIDPNMHYIDTTAADNIVKID